MVLLLGVTGVVSPWIAWAAEAVAGQPFTFARVYDRVYQVLLVLGLVLAWRSLDLGGPADIGLVRTHWARRLATGLVVGTAGLAVGLVLCWLLGGLEPRLRYDAAKTLRKAVLGLGAAVAVGVGEEALFRGVLLRRLRRDAGLVVAVAVTTIVYAAVHVLRARGGPGAVDAWSGLAQTRVLFAPLTTGAAAPELVGLALLGLLLAAARLRTGSLWTAIGIHAAWVAVFRVGRLFFVVGPRPAWLVGDGWPPIVGGVAGWIAVVACAVLLWRATRRGCA